MQQRKCYSRTKIYYKKLCRMPCVVRGGFHSFAQFVAAEVGMLLQNHSHKTFSVDDRNGRMKSTIFLP